MNYNIIKQLKKWQQKKVVVRFEGEFNFEYDPESPVFKEMYAHFQRYMHECSEHAVMENIAHNILLNGSAWDDLFEGIGYIDRQGRVNPKNKPGMSSGIVIDTDRPNIDYDSEEK